MKYKDFLQPFYNKDKDHPVLKGIKTKANIAIYFLELSFGEDIPPEIEFSEDTSKKWFYKNNTNNPSKKYWIAIEKVFNENKFFSELFNNINDDFVPSIASHFGITPIDNEVVNKKALVKALTLQFKDFVKGKGEADNKIKDFYYSKLPQINYSSYLAKTIKLYEVMTILGGTECKLEDCYVCNHISTRPEVFPTQNIIKNATVEDLSNFDKRGPVKRILLIGGGGSGKTLMLQHLFVDSANLYNHHKELPIFIELKNFRFYQTSLFEYIFETVVNIDESFSREELHKLLSLGKCQLFLDGMDEINPSDIKLFQYEINKFLIKYSSNLVIMTSRFSDAYCGIKGFVKLYILPFNMEQSQFLVDKLLMHTNPEAKEKLQNIISNGFIRVNGFFVTNPMMLTYLFNNYQSLEPNKGKMYDFYNKAYKAIIFDHDNEKIAFDRIYYCVDNSEEFEKFFSAFCAITFINGDFEFSSASFEDYFNTIKRMITPSNPKRFTCKEFLYDACSTACMMINQNTSIIYIDPIFQEYMFARYYAYATSEKLNQLYKILKLKPSTQYDRWDAFKMLYEISPIKMGIIVILPLLSQIFSDKTDEEAFLAFIKIGFDNIYYSVFNNELVKKYFQLDDIISPNNIGNSLTLKNALTAVILMISGVTQNIYIRTNLKEANIEEFKIANYVGVISQPNKTGQNNRIKIEKISLNNFKSEDLNQQDLFSDEGIVSFGFEYKIPTSLFNTKSTYYKQIIATIGKEGEALKIAFNKVKKLYSEISELQKKNQFPEYEYFYGKNNDY